MRLVRLAARDFRNLAPFELATDARFVVFSGDNAQGKTNALEAIYLLATLKPLRGRRNAELVRWGATEAAVAGDVSHQGLLRRYRVELGETGRKALVDGKPVGTVRDYFEDIRAIAFTPGDAEIVAGEPARRREWLDRAAFTASPVHLDVVRTYKRCLDQKSAVLREGRVDRQLLDALDQRLALEGGRLVERRVRLLRELEPHVRRLHEEIAGGGAALGLRYRTAADGESPEERADHLHQALVRVRDEEVRRGIALTGPQRDEVVVELDGRPARTFGSRGQVRSLVLALKLAELVAARERGDTPLFLLDDLSSELDRDRTRRLVATVEELGAQVFVTTTDPEHIEGLPEADTLHVRVHAGELRVSPP